MQTAEASGVLRIFFGCAIEADCVQRMFYEARERQKNAARRIAHRQKFHRQRRAGDIAAETLRGRLGKGCAVQAQKPRSGAFDIEKGWRLHGVPRKFAVDSICGSGGK